MRSTINKYGLRAFIVGAILFMASLVLGAKLEYGTQAILGYSSIVLSLLFVYFGIRHFRDNENDGKLTFVKALQIGITISLFAGVAFAIVDYIYTAMINPDFFAEYAKSLEEAGRGDEVFEMGSGLAALFMFATVMLIGFIISIISAMILQRK